MFTSRTGFKNFSRPLGLFVLALFLAGCADDDRPLRSAMPYGQASPDATSEYLQHRREYIAQHAATGGTAEDRAAVDASNGDVFDSQHAPHSPSAPTVPGLMANPPGVDLPPSITNGMEHQ